MAAYLDSSVIVRYLTGDIEPLANAAASVIHSDETLIISELALLETAYVLSRLYSVPRSDLVDALARLIQRENIRLGRLAKPLALYALDLCRSSNRYSFADAFMWAEAVTSDSPTTYTFDRRFPGEGVNLKTP